MLVLKDAFNDDELLAAGMGVRREVAARRAADDGGSARHLIPDPVKHTALDTGHRGRPPRQLRGVQRDAFGELGI